MLVCQPVYAASTTDSQYDFVQDDINLMSLRDNKYKISVLSYLYDSYTFKSLPYVSSSGGDEIVYKDGVSAVRYLNYDISSVVNPDFLQAVYQLRLGTFDNSLLCTMGESLSFRFVGIASQFDSNFTYYPADFVFDHAEITFYGYQNLTQVHDPVTVRVNATESFLSDLVWRSYFLSASSPLNCYYVDVKFYYNVNCNFDLLNNFRFISYFGHDGIGNIYISSSGGSGSDSSDAALDNLNNSVSSGFNSLNQTMNNGLMQLGDKVFQQTSQIVSSVTAMAGQMVQSVQAMSQDIQRQLGLLGDDVSNGFNNMVVNITNQTQQLQQSISGQTQQLTQKLDAQIQKIEQQTQKIEQGFKDTVREIRGLPAKIWDVFKKGLIELIVPDAQKLSSKCEQFNKLLEDKLGIIYQVPVMVFDLAKSLVNGVSNPQTTLTLPAFALPWIDGSSLELWSDYTFDVIPSGLGILNDFIQTVTSMLCVIALFNSLKNTYERFFNRS